MQIFDAADLSAGDFKQILTFLRAGGVVGIPTDTAYGLAADPFNETAVRKIFEIKGRPESRPILVLVDSMEMLRQTAVDSENAQMLARKFWPGPLTMIFPALGTVPRLVTAGTGTIGVRWPRAEFPIKLIRAFGGPITATSANKSGMPSAAKASEVREQLAMDLEMLIDGGTLLSPEGSTLLDLTQDPPRILRDGPVSRAALTEALNGYIQ